MQLTVFEKVADMLAKEHAITIHEGDGWAANIEQHKIFYVKNDVQNLPEDHTLGLLLHEIAHIHYTKVPKLPQKNKELTHTTLNMIEDISIEHIISSDYPNAGEILKSTKEEVLNTLVKMLPKLKASLHEKSLLYGAARFEGRGYATAFLPYEKIGNMVAEIMIREKDKIYNRKETKDLLPIVEEIVNLLIREAGEPTEQEKREMMEESMHGQANSGTKVDQAKREVIDSLKAGNGWIKGTAPDHRIHYVADIGDKAVMIGKEIRNVLKRNNAMEFGGRYRTGKLKTKRLVKIAVQKDRNPFARRIVKSNQSYAFAIACDLSGSMDNYGGRVSNASKAMSSLYMVAEALRYAKVPRALITFGERAKTILPMGKEFIRWETLSSERSRRGISSGGTNIEQAILKCTEELENVQAERKIMIVLTDGQSDMDKMKKAHKLAERKNIECLSITIGSDGWLMDEVFGKTKNRIIEGELTVGKAFIDILKESIKMSKNL